MKKIIIAVLALTPAFAFAQELSNLNRLLRSFGDLVDLALPIVLALALLAFFWGLVKFIFAAGDETAKEQGKSIMLWGIIALFIMVAVWGIVNWIAGALNISTPSTPPVVPTVPTP